MPFNTNTFSTSWNAHCTNNAIATILCRLSYFMALPTNCRPCMHVRACVCGLVLLSLVFSILRIQCPFWVLTLQIHTTFRLLRFSVWKWVNKLSLILNDKQCSRYDLPVFMSRMQLKLHWFVVAVEKVAGRWWHQRDQHFSKFYENCNGNTVVFFLCYRSENSIVSIKWRSFFTWLIYKIETLISNLNSLEKWHIFCYTSPSIFILINIKMNSSRFAK